MFMQDASRFTAAAAPALAYATPLRAGLLAGTRVETATGWRAVETLRRGDLVHSFDGGLRPVVAVDRDWLVPGADTVLVLPGGALNTSGDLQLLPGQMILLDGWTGDLPGGAPVALGPAEALEGLFGTRRLAVARPTEVLIPVFAEEEGIYTDGGLILHCPGVAAGPNGRSEDEFFARLDVRVARALLAHRDRAEAA
jgi:hypothetical protein